MKNVKEGKGKKKKVKRERDVRRLATIHQTFSIKKKNVWDVSMVVFRSSSTEW